MATIAELRGEIGDRVGIPLTEKVDEVRIVHITGTEIWVCPPIPNLFYSTYELSLEPRVGELIFGKNGGRAYKKIVQTLPFSFRGFKGLVERRYVQSKILRPR